MIIQMNDFRTIGAKEGNEDVASLPISTHRCRDLVDLMQSMR